MSKIEIGLRQSNGTDLPSKYRVEVFREDFYVQTGRTIANNKPFLVAVELDEDLGCISYFVIYKNNQIFDIGRLTHPKEVISGDKYVIFEKDGIQMDLSFLNDLFSDW